MDKQAIVDKAAVLLDYIAAGVEKGGEFVAEQAPLLAQEILEYGFMFHALWLTIMSVFLVLSLCLLVRSWRRIRRYDDVGEFGVLISIIGIGVSTTVACINLVGLLKVIYAPRLYLLDALRGLI